MLDPIGSGALVEHLSSLEQTLSLADFVRTPFSLDRAEDRVVFEELTADKAAFQARRENHVRTHFHMELADYEALFEQHRSSLLDLASALAVPYEEHTSSFEALLRRVDAAQATRERRAGAAAAGSFVEARVAVAALHGAQHLFRGRLTLHSLLVQDALELGLVEKIKDVYTWLKSNLPRAKCLLCKSVLNSLKRGACNAVGEIMCTTLVTMMTAGVGATASRFFCGFPVYLSAIFGRWCFLGVNYLQAQASISNQCICNFTIPSVSLPAVKFTLLGKELFSSPKIDLVTGGYVCNAQPGQCSGSKAERADYEKRRAVLEQQELKRIAAMTLQEKAWHHYQILSGELATNLSDKLVETTLTAATGLGSDALSTILKAGTGGGLKQAVFDLSSKLVGKTVKSVAVSAAKTVSTATKDAAVKMIVDRTRTIAYKGVDIAGAAVTKTVNTTIRAGGAATAKLQNKMVTSLTGNKELGQKLENFSTKHINNMANAAATVTGGATKFVGHRAIDVFETVAGQYQVGKAGENKNLLAKTNDAALKSTASAASQMADEGVADAAVAVVNAAKRITVKSTLPLGNATVSKPVVKPAAAAASL
jgi:hypothetical protein